MNGSNQQNRQSRNSTLNNSFLNQNNKSKDPQQSGEDLYNYQLSMTQKKNSNPLNASGQLSKQNSPPRDNKNMFRNTMGQLNQEKTRSLSNNHNNNIATKRSGVENRSKNSTAQRWRAVSSNNTAKNYHHACTSCNP